MSREKAKIENIDEDLAQFLKTEWEINADDYLKPDKEDVRDFISHTTVEVLTESEKERFLNLLTQIDEQQLEKLYKRAVGVDNV